MEGMAWFSDVRGRSQPLRFRPRTTSDAYVWESGYGRESSYNVVVVVHTGPRLKISGIWTKQAQKTTTKSQHEWGALQTHTSDILRWVQAFLFLYGSKVVILQSGGIEQRTSRKNFRLNWPWLAMFNNEWAHFGDRKTVSSMERKSETRLRYQSERLRWV